MLLGPHDKRLKRSRCFNCARRHLKCSKTVPCSRCSQGSLSCQYPLSGRSPIDDTAWRHNSTSTATLKCSTPSAGGPIKEAIFFKQFFDNFLRRNQFTGAANNWHLYLSTSLSRCQGHFAALAALGALVQYKQCHDSALPAHTLVSALRLYQDGVCYLQKQIDRGAGDWEPISVLSVAFLLSMFELVYDTTGVGWNSHMGFGTSAILQACGPLILLGESALAIYREIRLFEISRAALFSQTTLLTNLEWTKHDEACRVNLNDWNALEKAFDLFLQCVRLHQSVSDFEESQEDQGITSDARGTTLETMTLALDLTAFRTVGVRLQAQLVAFASSFTSPMTLEEEMPARAYSYAMLIYLSGVFDHGISFCQPTNPPILDSREIAVYREGIIHLCDQALKQGRVSSVLLLVPLRIAGNRCDTSMQCRKVLDLVCQIKRSFAVAEAFRGELVEIWKSRGLI